jgi:hypothetical protein
MSAPGSLDPESIVSPRPRAASFVDRYETGVALLVAAWTAAFLVRSRLAQSDRLTELANEALLSLLLVVPIMLVGWAALVVADRWFKLKQSRDRR